MSTFTIRDAIASVALSHPEKHDCVVCRCVSGTATPEEYAQVVWAMTWAMPQVGRPHECGVAEMNKPSEADWTLAYELIFAAMSKPAGTTERLAQALADVRQEGIEEGMRLSKALEGR